MEWILVADAAQARLLRRERDDEPLIPVRTWTHDATHDRPGETGTGRPGHGASDWHVGGMRFEPRVEAQRKEHVRFARELADRLEHAALDREYARLCIFAPPEFLGELRAALGHASRERLRATIDLDLSAYGLTELEERIGEALHATAHPPPPRF